MQGRNHTHQGTPMTSGNWKWISPGRLSRTPDAMPAGLNSDFLTSQTIKNNKCTFFSATEFVTISYKIHRNIGCFLLAPKAHIPLQHSKRALGKYLLGMSQTCLAAAVYSDCPVRCRNCYLSISTSCRATAEWTEEWSLPSQNCGWDEEERKVIVLAWRYLDAQLLIKWCRIHHLSPRAPCHHFLMCLFTGLSGVESFMTFFFICKQKT